MGLIKLPKKVALDSNIFIYALESNESQGLLSRKLLEDIKVNQREVTISVILVEELFVKIYKEGRESQKDEVLGFLSINGLTQVIDITQIIALKAAQIRAKYPKIKTPDAIHIACAIETKVKMFITTDRGLPKQIDSLKIVSLKDLSLKF